MQHQSNGLVEKTIGQLNESVRSTLLASDLRAYLCPEVHMSMCHTQNLVLSSALQRELKKRQKQEEEDMAQHQEQTDATTSTHNTGDKKRGELGVKKAKAARQPSDEIPIRNMILYLVLHRDVTDEDSQRLSHQLKPWGLPCFAYARRDHLRHLETR